MNLQSKKILVTGAAGFLGKAVIKKLLERGILKDNIYTPSFEELDLRKMENCEKAVSGQNMVIHLAAKAGGIGYSSQNPAQMFYDTAIIGIQLIEAARRAGVEKFVTIGSVCSYPKFAPVPFKENDLWNGYPEETNAAYGIAKKALLVQGQAYRQQYGMNVIHLLFVNMYGPGDNFDLAASHVIPAIIRKIKEAKENNRNYIDVWGTGKASREFLYVDDAAEAIVLAAEKYDKQEPVNVGNGREISIKDLAGLICKLTDFKGEIHWDHTKPDGQPKRCLDVSRAEEEFGFSAKMALEDGLKNVIDFYGRI